MSDLKLNQLAVNYGDKKAIKPLDVSFHSGEFTAICGEDGAGKTSLIKAIAGEVRHNGSVTLGNVESLMENQVSKCPQIQHLTSSMSVYDFVKLGFSKHAWTLPKNANETIQSIIQKLNLVSYARTAINNVPTKILLLATFAYLVIDQPKVVLIDEAVEDEKMVDEREVLEHLKNYAKENDAIVLYATTSQSKIKDSADRVVELQEGQLVES